MKKEKERFYPLFIYCFHTLLVISQDCIINTTVNATIIIAMIVANIFSDSGLLSSFII
jgi:hypothetical protein